MNNKGYDKKLANSSVLKDEKVENERPPRNAKSEMAAYGGKKPYGNIF
jgi:hypothetical protein